MNWTSSAGLRAQVQKHWDKGLLLRELAQPGDLFPLRLVLKGPSSADMSARFDVVRAWVRDLQMREKSEVGKGYRLEWRTVRHRVIGSNSLPDAAWVDTLDDALRLIGKTREAARFATMLGETDTRIPLLLGWLARYPLKALALANDWSRLLDVATWLQAHPRPGIYLRQLDLPGLHTKFVEGHRAVLAELFDLVLPESAVDQSMTGASRFLPRYGFREKPLRVRFRFLDATQNLLIAGKDQDIAVTQAAFAQINPAASRVFITENEVNFLAFPALADSMVVFGAGYGFDMLAQAQWLHDKTLYYWGDIDTHGFAILDQLRSHLPHAISFLMDEASLLAHSEHWTDEPAPTLRDLPRLTPQERAVYDAIRWKRLRDDYSVRLEQERISFGWLRLALEKL